MKKFLVIAMMVVLIGTSSVFAQGSSEADDVFSVAYIARAQGDSFAAWLANSIDIEMAKYPDMEVDIMDGQASDEKVNSFIENSITNQYDLIILQPNNGEAQTPYVYQVIEAGIPIILTNPRIPGIVGANSVDADPYEQGAVNARYALDLIPKNAKVLIMDKMDGKVIQSASIEPNGFFIVDKLKEQQYYLAFQGLKSPPKVQKINLKVKNNWLSNVDINWNPAAIPTHFASKKDTKPVG